MKQIISKYPGKIIISGEHSVLYGAPAITMPINNHIKSTISHNSNNDIFIDLKDLNKNITIKITDLLDRYKELKNNYRKYLHNLISISTVKNTEYDLIIFIIGELISNYNISKDISIKIKIESTIGIGCGLGSSAALIVCVLDGLIKYYGLTITASEFLAIAKRVENLQHGISSGIDINTIFLNKMLYFNEGNISSVDKFPFTYLLINTGQSANSSGDCIEFTKKYFNDNNSLIDKFCSVTDKILLAIKENNLKLMHNYIIENHFLLRDIGVVPDKVNNFIKLLAEQNISSKICGAGAISGNNSGYILAIINSNLLKEEKNYIKKLCQQFNYSCKI